MHTLEFRVLGPLEVLADGQPVPLGGRKPRLLLATLLLTPNRPVSTEHLIAVLWPTDPPRSAAANLRTYASALRARLGERIQSRPPGYVVTAADEELDLTRFALLAAEGRRLRDAGRPTEALAALRKATELWRDAPLADLPASPLWTAVLHPLAEQRLTARQDRLALQLVHSDHEVDSAIAELRGLVAEHPLREGLWQQLISALHGCGRRAEALRAYADLRRTLADELGVEPGPALHQLHLALLGEAEPGDPAADTPTGLAGCLLPADLPDFTGREEPLRSLIAHIRARSHGTPAIAMISEPPQHHSAPAVAVISGPPGIGKSALAVHAGHAVRAHFPDGQLYLDLGGAGTRPREPGELLGELLRTLGVSGGALPVGVEERAGRYRSLLAERRALVVLDNAASTGQVRPLLPAGPGCAVVVTSRSRLTDLAGAVQVELEPLTPAEAHLMLARIAGAERVGAEPRAANEILGACGYLPLAIRIAGAKLAGRRGWPLDVLAGRLADESRRLRELRVGQLGVHASIDISYQQLPAAAARAYRLLSLLGDAPFPGWVLGAVLDRADADAELDALVDANLVQLVGTDSVGQPQYRLHDLLLLYAREAAALDPPADRRDAVARVAGGWLARVERAVATLPAHVFTPSRRFAARWPRGTAPLEGTGDALAWLDATRPATVTAVAHAAAQNLDDLAWELAVALVPYLDLRSHLDEWQRTHRLALAAARRAGNAYGQAALLRGLGQLHLYRDAYRPAAEAFHHSVTLYRRIGDERGEASALSGLGAVHRVRRAFGAALDCYRRALGIFVRAGDQHGEAYARAAIGAVRLGQGATGPASEWLSEALRLAELTGDRHRAAHVRHLLGQCLLHTGEVDRAAASLERSLAEFETIGDRHGTAYALRTLGEVAVERGENALAATLLDRALSIVRGLGDRRAEADVRRALSAVHRAAGRNALARTHLARAETLDRALVASR
jgi:DNA-binding SARP family transcriptional activator